jgi:hypothetical protein
MLKPSGRARVICGIGAGLALAVGAAAGGAQEAAYVDTRGSFESRRSVDIPTDQQPLPGKNCKDGCPSLERPLSLQLVRLELGPQSVEWTIRIINQSDKPVRLPTSALRSETTVESAPGHNLVSDMTIAVSLSCASRAGTRRGPLEIDLYGAPDGSRGMSTIDPGQWMTVIGQTETCSDPGNDHDSYAFSATVSSLDTYRIDGKAVEEKSPVYGGASSGSVLWDGHGELAVDRRPRPAWRHSGASADGILPPA